MRMLTRLTVIPAILEFLVVTGSTAASLDRAGIWTPTKLQPPPVTVGIGSLINDGSFEQGPPPASAWTETNDSTCERIGNFSSVWYVSAYHGDNDYWAGGYCNNGSANVPIISSVAQTLIIPADTPQLSFYYISFRPDADDAPQDGDHAYVAVNGTEVWSLPLVQANNTYPNWSELITVDLSAYATQSISLSFGGFAEGNFTGNLRFDYIELTAVAPVETATWGRLKALF